MACLGVVLVEGGPRECARGEKLARKILETKTNRVYEKRQTHQNSVYCQFVTPPAPKKIWELYMSMRYI